MDRAPHDDRGRDIGAILRDRWSSAPRHLLGHGWRDPVASLDRVRALVADVVPDATDFYGADGVVEVLEDEVCDLLGLEAAVFMPSGTMAQQAALRCHVDAAGVTTVGWHPRAHPDLWEDQAMARLHGLTTRRIGDLDTLLTLGDLEEVDEPLAAILWELPQRELGGILPAFDDLVEQVAWARDRGIATHLDGVEVVPDPPQTTMFHLWLGADADALAQRMLDHLDRTGLFTWIGASPTPLPSWSCLEVQAGTATLDVDPDQFRALVRELVTGGPGTG